jgi:SAM-dependent methyltransferase
MRAVLALLRRAAVLACFACGAAWAQSASDAPYVPTPQPLGEAMLEMAGVGPADTVIDLGSGDGRVVITAARQFGARGIGVELDFHLLIQSEESARQAGVADRVRFLQQDLFRADLSQATVVTLYLLPAMYPRLLPRLRALKPGTRIVVHRFPLPGWAPVREARLEERYFLYVVPDSK